ncbi:MAG: TlpA family protein disulfide reductase [Candidatus Eremiobacteraeota bacterium]|nr:TlpA family protein disulfide reductase [Candidatus Eremiobacteraeota bacterium]
MASGTRRRWPAAIAVVAFAACSARSPQTARQADERIAHVGQPAPSWSEPTSAGTNLALKSLRGKVIYLNFFATWCPPCNEEAPAIEGLQREFAGKGLQVVGVDVLENAHKAQLFRSEHRLSYPAVVDDGALRDQYAVNGLPVHVFIDRGGIVRNIIVGELSMTDMRANIRRLLQDEKDSSASN